jgi:hypothetical protein
MVWPGVKRYEGEFRDGLFHGHGVMTLTGFGVYEGEFRRGKREGAGTLRRPDGRVDAGVWRDGVLVERVTR